MSFTMVNWWVQDRVEINSQYCPDKICKFKVIIPIGQRSTLQGCDLESILVALQFLPPMAGAGLVQDLICVWFPPPQLKLQELQGDQSDQAPSEKSETFTDLYRQKCIPT